MGPIGPDRVDPKWELLDHVVNEVDRARLVVAPVNLERSGPCGIVNGRVLEGTDLGAVSGLDVQELHVHLDVMTGNLLGIPARVNRPAPDVLG